MTGMLINPYRFAAAGGSTGYNDDFNGSSLDPKWTNTNLTVTPDAANGEIDVSSASGTTGRFMQAFTDTGQGFEVRARFKNLSNVGGMTGIVFLGASAGLVFCPYASNTYFMNLNSSGVYASTVTGSAGLPTLTDFWLRVVRSSTSWTGYYSNDGTTWSAAIGPITNALTVTSIGLGRTYAAAGGAVTVSVDRFDYGTPTI